MSNYPPGVTGREYAIAGGTPVRGEVWRHVTHGCDPELYDEDFDGDVEVDDVEYAFHEYTGFYTCPQCGAENVELTWEPEEDADV